MSKELEPLPDETGWNDNNRRSNEWGFEPTLTAESFARRLKPQESFAMYFLIDPRTSKALAAWDTTGGLILVYTAFVTPYEVAFLGASTTWLGARFLLNRAIDFFFLCDMVLQLFIMVPVEKQNAIELSQTMEVTNEIDRSQTKTLSMVTHHGRIALHYLKSWFVIDLVSVLSGLVDILMVTPLGNPEEGSTSGLEQLRVLRVLRVLRLIKLVRLLKTSRLLKRWQSAFSLDFSTQTLIYCLVSYLVAGHWFACILVLSTTMADSPMHTWLASKGYCQQAPNGPEDLRYGATWELQPVPLLQELAHLDDVYCVSSFSLWVGTYYWMMQLISGSAGGDTNQWDLNTSEQIVFTVLVIAACLLSSQIIASFCDVVSNLNPEGTAYKTRMDALNRYCRTNKLHYTVRRQLREYLLRAKRVQVAEAQRELLEHMSPKLQGELALQVSGTWITQVPFLRRVETDCSIRVALALRSRVYVPTELIPADCMYMLSSGLVTQRGRVIAIGKMWGADCILNRVDLRSRPARALTYVEVDYIYRDLLLEILHSTTVRTNRDGSEFNVIEYPKAVRRLRWYTVMLGIIREYQRIRSKLDSHARNASRSEIHNAWNKALHSMDGLRHLNGTPSPIQERRNLRKPVQIGMLWKPPAEIQLWA